MNRRATIALLLSPLSLAQAAGLGAVDYRYLDGVQIDPSSGIATLLLAIDRPLEDGLTKPKVRSKIRAYHQWVFVDKKLTKYFPEAKPEKGVRLVFLHPMPKNALGTSVLEQLVGHAKEMQFQASAQAVPEKK